MSVDFTMTCMIYSHDGSCNMGTLDINRAFMRATYPYNFNTITHILVMVVATKINMWSVERSRL